MNSISDLPNYQLCQSYGKQIYNCRIFYGYNLENVNRVLNKGNICQPNM